MAAKKTALVTSNTPGIKMLKETTLHHTTDGHYKYYYLYLFTKDSKVYLEKKWGRIGSVKGSANVTEYKMGLTMATSTGTKDFNQLKKAKTDKGYKEVDLSKTKIPEPPAEIKGPSFSRFRDM